MKTSTSFSTLGCSALLGAAIVLLPGCKPPSAPSSPSTPATAAAPAPIVSAEKTSFQEVTAKLDPGGSLYAYLSTAQWLDGLSQKLVPWQEALFSSANIPESERQTIRRVADTLGSLIRQSGLESVSGVGLSGIALEPGYYRSKLVVHHHPGAGQGYLWTLFGTEPHPFDFVDWLPTNTAWVATTDLDVATTWKAIRDHVAQAGIPEVSRGLDQFVQRAEQASGMTFDELLGSLAGEFAFALTLDPTRTVRIPMPSGEGLDLPEPGLILAMKVRDDRWFEWADRVLASNPQVAKADDQASGLRLRAMPLPLPIPMELRPSVARAGNYLWLTTHDRLMQQLVQVKAGQLASLRSSPEFQRLTQGLPTTGNQFTFASEGLQGTVTLLQQAAIAANNQGGDAPPAAFMQKLMAAGGSVASASVATVGPEGWLTVAHGHQEPATTLMLSAVVAPVAVVAGMTLPALSKAKSKAQSIACVNNLKQLGLGAIIYATDHDDTLPPDVLSLRNELGTPRVLVCPMSPASPKATSLTWETLQPGDVSYEYLGAGKKHTAANPQDVLFRCRIHGHTCRMDGSVLQHANPGAN